jgi:Transposase DDE domain
VTKLSKSPLQVARHALALANAHLPLYAHRFSPKTYTQPQLFVCLVLKTFFGMDYRGLTAVLEDFDALQSYLGLRRVPHFTTLQKASRRLLRTPRAKELFHGVVRRFRGRKRRLKLAAMDSTGLDLGRRSAYYVRRRQAGKPGKKRVLYSRFAKLEACFDCQSHLILAAFVGRGPRPDVDRFVPLLDATLEVARPQNMLADAGYDSEGNHRHARVAKGVRSFMPATHGRPTNKPLSGRFRRQMKKRLNKDYGQYGQRWQAETGFSMIKRCLSDTIQGRSYWSQCRELWLLIITYNILLL